MGTRGAWAKDFLVNLGNADPSPKTINLVAAWTRQEFGSDVEEAASYNPLATTLGFGTYTNYNTVGVKNYSDRFEGIRATTRTLLGDHEGYADIVRGLTTNDVELALSGMKRAPWGTNFARVEQVFRAQDVTGETVPGEDPAKWRANSPAKPPTEADADEQAPIIVDGGQSSPPPSTSGQIEISDVRAAFQAMGGAGLMAIGGLLVILALAKTIKTSTKQMTKGVL